MRRAWLVLALVSWLGPASPVVAAEPTTVSFLARDGTPVTGVLYLPDKRPAPAVILLHMVTRSHADWATTAARLSEAGVAALAIDFRRGALPGPGHAGEGSEDYSDLVLDAVAAHAFLAARPDIASGRIGMAGASIGANVAVMAAAAIPAIRSLALLSPSLDYRGLRIDPPLRKYGSRPAIIIASDDDPYALRTSHQLVGIGDGLRDVRIVSGAGHGTVMLTRQPELVGTLVDWFLRTLVRSTPEAP